MVTGFLNIAHYGLQMLKTNPFKWYIYPVNIPFYS